VTKLAIGAFHALRTVAVIFKDVGLGFGAVSKRPPILWKLRTETSRTPAHGLREG